MAWPASFGAYYRIEKKKRMVIFKNTLLFLIFLSPFFGLAQLPPKIDSLFNDPTKMSAKSLVGTWETNDSIPWEIEFIENPHEVVLSYNGSRSYSFYKDTDGIIGVRGIMMQWPPHYCHIEWIDGMQLELTFYSLTHSNISHSRTIFRKPE